MASVTQPTAAYSRKVGVLNQAFTDVYNFNVEKWVYPKLFNRAGHKFGMLDMLMIMGRQMAVPNQTLSLFEKGFVEEPLIIAASGEADDITTDSGSATQSFKLNASNYAATLNAGPLRQYDSVLIPGSYTGTVFPTEWQVTDISGTGTAQIYTIKPFKTGVTTSAVVPAGTNLMIGANKHGEGTGQPSGRVSSWIERTFTPSLYKETFRQYGGQGAVNRYTENMMEVPYSIYDYKGNVSSSGKAFVNDQLIDVQFNMYSQINKGIFFSQTNTNSLTETNIDGGSSNIISGEGYVNIADTYGNKQYYNTNFTMFDFDESDKLLEAQGVIDGSATFFTAKNLMRNLENQGIQFVADNSKGTNFYDDKLAALGVNMQTFRKSGRQYNCVVIDNFNNPGTFGANSGYRFSDMGIIIPDGEATFKNGTSKKEAAISNVTIGNVNANGEDRSMVITDVNGVNGYGLAASNEYDANSLYLLAHKTVLVGNANQHILVMKTI